MIQPNCVPRVLRGTSRLIALAAVIGVLPGVAHAQSDKWVGTITLLNIDNKPSGAADITVEPRGDKESRVKISVRNSKKELRLGWDVVSGRCREEGIQVAAQAKFQVIQTGMDGSGVGTANVPKLEGGKLYAVRVFESGKLGSDKDAYGCAMLSEK